MSLKYLQATKDEQITDGISKQAFRQLFAYTPKTETLLHPKQNDKNKITN